MKREEKVRATRFSVVVAMAATALVGILPASAAAQSSSVSAERSRAIPGYVCNRVEKDERAGVGSGRCVAVNGTRRRGDIRGAFTIKKRGSRYTLHCDGQGSRPSGHANLPNWVRGRHCH